MPLVQIGQQQIQFPDTMSNQDIEAAIGTSPDLKALAMPQQASQSPIPSEIILGGQEPQVFFGRTGDDLSKRSRQFQDINTGGQTWASTGLQGIGTIAGAVGDVGGNIAGNMARQARDYIMPDVEQQYAMGDVARQGLNAVADTQVGHAIGQGAQQVGQAIGDFKQNYPVTAADIGAVGNIASVIPVLKGAGMAKNLAGDVIETAAKSVPSKAFATADEVGDLAREAYKDATIKGGVLKPTMTNKFLDEIQAATPQTAAGKMISGDNEVTKLIDRAQGLKDRPLSLDEAQEIDEHLGDLIDANTELGRVTKEGKKLLDVQSSFRNMIDSATAQDVIGGKEGFDSLKKARGLWSKSVRLRDVERIVSRAETMDNPSTAIRTGFRNLLNNPSRIKGYTLQERTLIRKAAESGVISDILGVLGSRLNPIAGLATGGLGGAAAAQASSMAARGARTAIQVNRAQKVARTIAGRK